MALMQKPQRLEKVERMKPPHSYIALIATAILNSPEKRLTLTEINDYLVKNYSFFRGTYQGWKNSVRHNLSFNKCFVKILRDPARPWGKDNYWTVSSLNDYLLSDGTFRRRRRRKPKKREIESVARRERLLQADHSGFKDNLGGLEGSGTHGSVLVHVPCLSPKDHRGGTRPMQQRTSPKFRGPFSIENILADQGVDERRSSTSQQDALPTTNQNTAPAMSLGTPKVPQHFHHSYPSREYLVFNHPQEMLPPVPHSCEVWNTYPQCVPHYFYPCY